MVITLIYNLLERRLVSYSYAHQTNDELDLEQKLFIHIMGA